MDNKGASRGETLFSIVFLIWFLGSIAGLVIAAKIGQPGWALVIFGQYFVVFGIIALHNEIKNGFRNPIFLIFLAVGLIVVTCALMWQLGDDAAKKNVIKQIPNVAAGIFFLVGVLLFAGIISEKKQQKKCTCAVQGKCVEVKWHYSNSSGGGKTYCPVYEYYYNGQVYTGSQGIYTNLLSVGEGEYREIFLNPDKPDMFYEKGMSHMLNGVSLFFSVTFIAVSAVVIYAYNFM
ncbi:MAG: hypothetical protein IJ429_01390 [Lachnospiraceae bacterium]|nr:hypothetical protein [Lachnospiraceae bacterium]